MIVSLDGEQIDEIVFWAKGGVKRWYYLGKKEDGEDHEFLFEVSRTWNPRRLGVSKDPRDLGLAVSEVRFLDKMPKDGVGFYHSEIWGGGKVPGWPEDIPIKFRWTGMRASQAISDFAPEKQASRFTGQEFRISELGTEFSLKCSHPDIDREAVVVKILGNGRVIREENFGDHGWRKIVLANDELNNTEVLTFQVNRTWNPKLAGISEDWRDLGVAVAVLTNDYTNK